MLYCLVIYNRRIMQSLPFEQFANTYTVISQLGRGASGICYRIVTIKDRREFALKKIPLHLVEPTKITSQLSLLTSVQHPNIIRLHQSFLSKDFLYLLFEYNQQKDLQKMIKERERADVYFEEEQLWAYLRQILQALIYLHELGVLHRDVKPSNIFVDKEGGLQLGDLGSAKMAERQNYTRIGTPYYLAPEIIKYEAYGEKVDIWSLGVTLYQLTALKLPFQHPNFLKLAQSITYQEPQYQFRYSRRLKACIAEMLRKDPKERPSAQDLLDRYFVAPIETPPFQEQQQVQSNSASLHSVELQPNQDFQQTQTELEQLEPQWSGLRDQGLAASGLISKQSIQRSSLDEEQPLGPSPRISSIKTLKRASSNRRASREDEVRQNSASFQRSQLEDGDDTIVLKVNPNDGSNFCGYYRESPRPSRVYFAPSDSNNPFKMGRKSSLFKHTPESETQNPSQFKTNNMFKENKSFKMEFGTHKRQESAIGARQKHGKLMSALRPSRHGREQDDTREVGKPELIVIDLKPLLLPFSEEF